MKRNYSAPQSRRNRAGYANSSAQSGQRARVGGQGWRDAQMYAPPMDTDLMLRWADGSECDGRWANGSWQLYDCNQTTPPAFWALPHKHAGSHYFLQGCFTFPALLTMAMIGIPAAFFLYRGAVGDGLILIGILLFIVISESIIHVLHMRIKTNLRGCFGETLAMLVAVILTPLPFVLVAVLFWQVYIR